MGELRAKLQRAFGGRPDSPAASGGLLELLRRHARRGRPVSLPAGAEECNARGAFWLVRQEYPSTHRHGSRALADALRLAAARDCVFLDTETTGLSGGAGTVVFLTGLARLEQDRVVVEQAFLRAFADEAAMLYHVAERIAGKTLVTFVGKSFDRHRLAARMAVQKIAADVLTPRHVDLYYAARRAWRRELPDVRLRTVEERKLGLLRKDDLPGSEAPVAFLEWLRDRTGAIDRVFEHNRLDVLSLIALYAELVPSAAGAASG
jgi:hypothetical protein